jgi:heme-degrading monooxygenase HmoA
VRTDKDESGYAAMAERMAELAAGQPGFLGMESVRERWYHQYRVRVARVERE